MTISGAIEECAAGWLIRREAAAWSTADQAALDVWLNESMAHKAAYWRLEYGWRKADRIAAIGGTVEASLARDTFPRHWLTNAAMAISLVAIGTVGPATYEHEPKRSIAVAQVTFKTPVGGRNIIPLSDGSKVEMNTATVLRAAVTGHSREIWLDQGEAYFEVVRAEDRPFVVHAGSRNVIVLGTKFSVRRDYDKVTVAVVVGKVRVDDTESQTVSTAIIVAGDIAIARGPATLLAARSAERVANGLAWRNGMLTFDQLTLAEAATEFNRYNRKQIEIVDSETANTRIGGTFQASNVEAFVRLLRDAYGFSIQSNANTVRISA